MYGLAWLSKDPHFMLNMSQNTPCRIGLNSQQNNKLQTPSVYSVRNALEATVCELERRHKSAGLKKYH